MVDFDAEAPIQRREAAELRRQGATQAVVDQGELGQRREAADFGRHATGERAERADKPLAHVDPAAVEIELP